MEPKKRRTIGSAKNKKEGEELADVTFSSRVMARDVTFYAAASDRGTLLAVAKAHKIPIPFDGQDGECGSCLAEAKRLSRNRPHELAVTEKEKERRLHLGQAKARASSTDLEKRLPPDYLWPEPVTPGRASVSAADPSLARLDGLKAALPGEQGGYEFCCAAAATTNAPEVEAMAKAFVKEEAERVGILEAWVTREGWEAKPSPGASKN